MKFLDIPLQDYSIEPLEVINELDKFGAPATVAITANKYFGFVIGGALPAPLAANLLAVVWDQNAGIEVASPISSFIETICRKWLINLLKLPLETEVGFVTSATMANFTGLAAARYALLKKVGWDAENDGLFNAPPIQVIVGEEVHVSVLKTLSMLGLGKNKVTKVPVDARGRMKANLILKYSEPALICIQAGNVNTGAFDPISEICEAASLSNARVHVGGAFGLWVTVSPRYAHLNEGIHKANSWATDAHKWLNVPELSKRARGIEIWAALRSLGKKGLASLIESNCDNASLFAKKLYTAGYRVLNNVVLNQVLVSFGDSETIK